MPIRSILYTSAALAALAAVPAHASFVGAFHENLEAGNNALFIFGAEGTTGTITGNDGLNETFTIGLGGVFERNFGSRGREMTSNGTVNVLSFSVESADPISGLALNRGPATTDMTTLLDTDALGTDYRVLSFNGRFGEGSQVSVTAVEDNTDVTITAPLALAGNAANTPFTVTLNKGESVFYESGVSDSDLTGTKITSTKKVAVFSGAECTQVPLGVVACDHIVAQQFSTDNFDTEFRIVENFGAGADGDLVRVLTDTDGTEVFLNGVSQGTINAGQFIEISDPENGVITSSAPVTVGQFTKGTGGSRPLGDPAFAIIPSVDQQLDSYAYATPVGGDVFAQNFLNIAIDSLIASSLSLNGSPVDTSGFIDLSGILFGNIAIDQGFGKIEASADFLATISGFDNADSYFTPIATAFSPGVSPPPPPPPPPHTPAIPLPAGGVLLVTGLAAMTAMRRRKS